MFLSVRISVSNLENRCVCLYAGISYNNRCLTFIIPVVNSQQKCQMYTDTPFECKVTEMLKLRDFMCTINSDIGSKFEDERVIEKVSCVDEPKICVSNLF